MQQHTDKLDMRNLDPRVVRTRHLLIESFDALRKENKSLRSLSVRDITERANVNRVTFYDHFTDKYEILNVWKRDMFRKAYKSSLVSQDISRKTKLRNLIVVVLDFIDTYNESKKPTNRQFEPLLEAAIQQEIKTILQDILKSNLTDEKKLAIDTMATFLSWAIFGSANDWSHHKTVEKQEMAERLIIYVQNVLKN